MAKHKKTKSPAESVSDFFGGLLGGVSKSIKSKKKRESCGSRGLGYNPSTGKCSGKL